MAYLGLSPEPDFPDQYYSAEPQSNCARYCAWLAAKQAGSLTMDYMERPPGCTCPGEVDNKKAGFPVTKTGAEQYDLIEQRVQPAFVQPAYSTELPMTPQQIEAQVKQAPQASGGLALAAIAAFLILGA